VAFASEAADHVTLDTTRPPGCEVTGPFGGTIAGQNLINVTLAKLASADPDLKHGHVVLTKNLPVAAGIGGGSADAAAVLRAVQRANPEHVSKVDWHALAMSLGADVPVCFDSHLSWMTGVGDRVTRLNRRAFNDAYVVIANPLVPVPADKTAQVFRALRAPDISAEATAKRPPARLEETDLFSIIASGRNDLERAAIEVVPEVSGVLSDLAAFAGAKVTRMSGGGPTCFALFETANAAQAAAASLRAIRPKWWIAASALA